MTDKTRPASIAEYIAARPPAVRPTLETLHACLSAVAPDARQDIKWGHPTYTGKRILFSFAAFKNHINFYPTPAVIAAFAPRLSDRRTTSAAISFPLDKPLPLGLIEEIARYRLRAVEEDDAHWM